MWRCPVCRQALHESTVAGQGAALTCSNGHCYDVAKEGYVNLLLANRKQSQAPGDNKAMIAARGRVHDAGLFQRLAVALQEQLSRLDRAPSRILDLGCGEGYYGAAVQEAFPAAQLLGIDIAKPAVRLAAKKYPAGDFAVASAFDVPLPDASQDLVLSVFAPLDAQEVSRLLAPGGIYLKVTPAPRHLWELRGLLYEQPEPHQVDSQQLEGFESLLATELNYTLQLDGDTLRDLVAMTPYAHKGRREGHDKLGRLDALALQMCFSISVQRLV